VYLDNCSADVNYGPRLELIGLTLRLHGATVINCLTDDISHVIVSSRSGTLVNVKDCAVCVKLSTGSEL